jgi:hypothetical protein
MNTILGNHSTTLPAGCSHSDTRLRLPLSARAARLPDPGNRLLHRLLLSTALSASSLFLSHPAAAQFVCDSIIPGGGDGAAAGPNSVACGTGANASGGNATAFGSGANASGGFNIAIGTVGPGAGPPNASGSGAANIAIGGSATATGDGAQNIAMGVNAQASGVSNNIAIGPFTNAAGGIFSANIAMGNTANSAGGPFSGNIAIGQLANASGDNTFNTAVGHETVATGSFSAAFGVTLRRRGPTPSRSAATPPGVPAMPRSPAARTRLPSARTRSRQVRTRWPWARAQRMVVSRALYRLGRLAQSGVSSTWRRASPRPTPSTSRS